VPEANSFTISTKSIWYILILLFLTAEEFADNALKRDPSNTKAPVDSSTCSSLVTHWFCRYWNGTKVRNRFLSWAKLQIMRSVAGTLSQICGSFWDYELSRGAQFGSAKWYHCEFWIVWVYRVYSQTYSKFKRGRVVKLPTSRPGRAIAAEAAGPRARESGCEGQEFAGKQLTD